MYRAARQKRSKSVSLMRRSLSRSRFQVQLVFSGKVVHYVMASRNDGYMSWNCTVREHVG